VNKPFETGTFGFADDKYFALLFRKFIQSVVELFQDLVAFSA